jgi:predicted dithiol-disulfide oxidoreductase (DUF899 family)
MPEHKVGTREEWSAARAALLEREQQLDNLDEEVAKEREELPWVRVEKEYVFDTGEGKTSLAELFDGRSQLLIYHLMFGPSYKAACPGCTGLADHLDPARPPEQPRRDLALHLGGAAREAPGVQATDGLAVPVRVLVRE